MTDLSVTPFLFEGENLIRVVQKGDMPWFVAKDVCEALHIQNHKQAIQPLDDDERGYVEHTTPGGPQEMLIISEGGMFTLVLRCRDAVKPGTVPHRFRKWVTSEVLPSIHRTGQYTQPSPMPFEPETPEGLKLRKVNTAIRCFGERAGAQLWQRVGLEIVPAMLPVLAQMDIFEVEQTTVTRMMGASL